MYLVKTPVTAKANCPIARFQQVVVRFVFADLSDVGLTVQSKAQVCDKQQA